MTILALIKGFLKASIVLSTVQVFSDTRLGGV